MYGIIKTGNLNCDYSFCKQVHYTPIYTIKRRIMHPNTEY